ncbi:hydrogenase expression/formation protein HypE [Microbulbifer variabilis]|uniref:hydrogenase expression/formation protein HypE n=1 Tax=Microbulbifer variabilis TaxID=266805 RepID=UPI001CFD3264|nr:hydrogenase expression/formation protein HypE [Microbulbifer variabilis]
MNIQCPLPTTNKDSIRLGHGSGGEMTQQLLKNFIQPLFKNTWIDQAHDSATLPWKSDQLVFTTDSFVITPLFFPGGDIGKLAVYGTVNDLAMGGAEPKFLSCSLILEEGLPLSTLKRVLESMATAAEETGIKLVTGDTKVVERGKGDGIYINTSGVGTLLSNHPIDPSYIRPGDRILLSGDIGRHGIAVMASREGLEFESALTSDCAPLNWAVKALLQGGVEIHCLRDLTRGGLTTALVELAETSGRAFELDEEQIPVCESVQGACEMLGLDPLYVANEGRFVAVIPEEYAGQAIAILGEDPVGESCAIIGQVSDNPSCQVILKNGLGCDRLLQRLPGEQLPRIC